MKDSLGWRVAIQSDIGYVFRLNPSISESRIYWVDVEVYGIYGYMNGIESQSPEDYSLKPRGWTGSEDSVLLADLNDDNCEWEAKGYIKWDGCSNIEFNNCVHICGMSDAKDFAAMILRLWESVQKLCESNDQDFG